MVECIMAEKHSILDYSLNGKTETERIHAKGAMVAKSVERIIDGVNQITVSLMLLITILVFARMYQHSGKLPLGEELR